MTAEDNDRFVVDFQSMSIVYDGGFSVPIVGMIDRFGEETDDADEADLLLIRVPPEGIVLTMLMDDLEETIVRLGTA